MSLAGEHQSSFSGSLSEEEAKRIAKEMFEGTFTGKVDKKMTGVIAKHLREAMTEGFGADFPEIAFNTPDYEMLAALDVNVYQFAGAKNYQQVKAFNAALKDKDGKLRTYSQFKEEVLEINQVFMEDWLRTEYDTAVGSAQMAGRWAQYKADEKALPYLRYKTAGDKRVRTSHRQLEGVTRRISDDFWKTYYPPNGWNCRCDVIRLFKAAETDPEKIIYPDVPEMFRTNLAEHGLLFPADHPYYKGAPAEVVRKGQAVFKAAVRDWAKSKLIRGKVEVYRKELKGSVTFNSTGIKEALNQPHYNQPLKDRAIFVIDKLLAKAKYVRTDPDVKGNHMVKQYHYYEFLIGDKPNYIVVREMINGDRFFYSIVDRLK